MVLQRQFASKSSFSIIMDSIKYDKFSWSCLNPVTKARSNWSVIIILMMFYFQSGQLRHSTNTIILKSNEHKSYAWVFGGIYTFQSKQFFDRLSMYFGVVDHFRASALTTADRRLPSWNRISDSTHVPPVGNVGRWTPLKRDMRWRDHIPHVVICYSIVRLKM